MTALTTRTVSEVVRRQKPSPGDAERLGGLLTGTILMRETMAPSLRVQGVIRGMGGKGTLVADSHPDGTSRGLMALPEGKDQLELGPGATLMMMRTLPAGKLHQGVVSMENAPSISDALMRYMQESEQVRSMIDVACLVRDGEVVAAGGYIIQLLPDLTESQLAIMTERLADFPPMGKLLVEGDGDAKHLMDELLYGMPYTMLGDSPLRFDCKCSHMRVVATLATLDRAELNELVADGKTLEIGCDFCGKDYAVTPEQIRGLLSES
jgi:molecular chaperone Hsp33